MQQAANPIFDVPSLNCPGIAAAPTARVYTVRNVGQIKGIFATRGVILACIPFYQLSSLGTESHCHPYPFDTIIIEIAEKGYFCPDR